MKTRNNIYRQWALLLMLLIGLPLGIKAQTVKFEMVLEKIDGTELTFRITDDYPLLQYQYGGEEGINTIAIQTASGFTSVPCPEIKRLYTREYKPVSGDVTGSGTVDVQDATLVVNYILGNGSDEYDYTVADMNGDNEVDVFDVTAMINVILASSNNAPTLRRSMEPNESVRLSADGNEVLVAVDNASRFTSFQFDVKVLKGAELLGVDWNGKMDSHLLQFAKTGEDTYKVVALSMESTPLSDLNDILLKLHMSNKTVGEMAVDNILFVTPQGEAVRFGSHPLDMTTGIQSVTHSQAGQIYDLSGQRLNMQREQLPKGVYIINNQKVVIK